MQRHIDHLITARQTSDGAGVRLRRSLGGHGARPDPFLMLDEFDSDRPDEYIGGFPPHPHRGFETVTLMLEGRMLHEDHMGNQGMLEAGGVQWMTAGAGIIHSEMPQQVSGRMRGFQLWINLPAAEKMKPPHYRDLPASEIPRVSLGESVSARLVAGRIDDIQGPVSGVTVNPLLLDVEMETGDLDLPVSATATVVVYVYEGQVRQAEGGIAAGQAAVMTPGDRLVLSADGPVRLLVLAAEPLDEPVVQHGPFVMNTRAEIEQAMADYRDGRLAWRPETG